MSIGDRCAQVEADDHAVLAAITGLTERAVRERLRREHGNRLLRNAFAAEWPRDPERLGALTAATALRGGLQGDLAVITPLTPLTVHRRLQNERSSTRLVDAFPELLRGRRSTSWAVT